MSRRHHYRRKKDEEYDIDVTTFLNLMVVLVPFLLITAVFSRLTIVELNVPSSQSGGPSEKESFHVEVIVRRAGLEITNGTQTIANVPKKRLDETNEDEQYDLATLSSLMVELKREHPSVDSASVLMEEDIEYDYLIQVMDIVRSMQVPIADAKQGEPQFEVVALFDQISVGDAP